MIFGKLFFANFFVHKSKGFPMVLQACRSKALAFVLLALFGGALDFTVLVAFCRFWKIVEQRILFSYMAAYGATHLPTNSVCRCPAFGWAPGRALATISGPWSKSVQPGLAQYCPSTAPALPQHCPSTATALPQHCHSTAPALPQHCPTTATALPQHNPKP